MVSVTPFRVLADSDDYLARLSAVPRYFDQVTGLLQRGITLGWVQPNGPLRGVPNQIEGQLTTDPTKSPFYAPFASLPDEIPASDRDRLRAAARDVIANSVVPAFTRFRDFVRDTYLPAGNRPIGASTLPNGAAYYRYAARLSTTTALSADSIHRLGLAKAKEHALTGKPLSGAQAAEAGLINRAVPFEELEREVAATAAQLAGIPASQLAAMKLIVNQAYENMGLASTQTLGPILDGLMRNTPDARRFIEVAERDGVGAATAERDGPFGDYSQAPEDMKPSRDHVIDPG
jgi:uncharacterized protein (DUF885 family)